METRPKRKEKGEEKGDRNIDNCGGGNRKGDSIKKTIGTTEVALREAEEGARRFGDDEEGLRRKPIKG